MNLAILLTFGPLVSLMVGLLGSTILELHLRSTQRLNSLRTPSSLQRYVSLRRRGALWVITTVTFALLLFLCTTGLRFPVRTHLVLERGSIVVHFAVPQHYAAIDLSARSGEAMCQVLAPSRGSYSCALKNVPTGYDYRLLLRGTEHASGAFVFSRYAAILVPRLASAATNDRVRVQNAATTQRGFSWQL